MKLLFGTLCLCLALAVSLGAPTQHTDTSSEIKEVLPSLPPEAASSDEDHNSTHSGEHGEQNHNHTGEHDQQDHHHPGEHDQQDHHHPGERDHQDHHHPGEHNQQDDHSREHHPQDHDHSGEHDQQDHHHPGERDHQDHHHPGEHDQQDHDHSGERDQQDHHHPGEHDQQDHDHSGERDQQDHHHPGEHHPQDHDHSGDHDHSAVKPDRCDVIEFDAIAPDEKGIIHFFKDDQVWKGFKGASELVNGTFHELDDHHHLDHVDAAFRMHSQDQSKDHDHIFIFMGDKVFSYYNHSLEKGYPKEIHEVFPGIPSHLDAAVECPKGECSDDSVIFFKDGKVYHFDVKTKIVKEKEWPQLPRCTSALRWLEHYYCVHGHNFTRFHVVTGAVPEGYPKDMRRYFMSCPGFDHGHENHFNCTNPHLDAITTDDAGKGYSFRGEWYLRLDNQRDGSHAFPISNAWKEVHSNVDAVFSYDNKLYFIKGQQIYIYKSGAHYTLIEGYPKPLKEELGVEGPVNAAFACEGKSIAYIIQGQNMCSLNLSTTPRTMIKDTILPIANVEAATCDSNGVRLFVGSAFYHYDNPNSIAGSRNVLPQETPKNILGCDHEVRTPHSGTHASN